jgi:hypothetical protein
MSSIPCPVCVTGTIKHGYCKGCKDKVNVGELAARETLKLEVFHSGVEFTPTQVANVLGCPPRAASNGLKLLLERCEVTQVREGVYKKRVLHKIFTMRWANPVTEEDEDESLSREACA